jgi:hypothetical protein
MRQEGLRASAFLGRLREDELTIARNVVHCFKDGFERQSQVLGSSLSV